MAGKRKKATKKVKPRLGKEKRQSKPNIEFRCSSAVENVWRRHEKGHGRVVAHMTDGSVVEVRSLDHQVQIMNSGKLRGFCVATA